MREYSRASYSNNADDLQVVETQCSLAKLLNDYVGKVLLCRTLGAACPLRPILSDGGLYTKGEVIEVYMMIDVRIYITDIITDRKGQAYL